jgi:hypothetical protein
MTTLDAEKIRMPFGYYKDSTLGEIAAADVLYLEHIAGQAIDDAYLRDGLAALVEKHADAIAGAKARGEKPKLFNASSQHDGRPRPQQMKLF